MKAISAILCLFFFLLLAFWAGCEPAASETPSKADSGLNQLSVYASYVPVKVDIMPLTEFITVGDDEEETKIRIYVSFLDAFDSQIKTPGVFRFELYERVQRSAEPKGGRITIWPDIDLTDVVKNNEHWRDFLRAYEFTLDFKPAGNQSYILQVTCLCPSGRRLSAEFELKPAK
jgi:hypothetical protein